MNDGPHAKTETFSGQVSSVDPHDLPAGAAELQVNLWSPRLGTLESRPGLRECASDTE